MTNPVFSPKDLPSLNLQTDGEHLIFRRAFQQDGKWYDLRIRQFDSFGKPIEFDSKTPFSKDTLSQIQKIAGTHIFTTFNNPSNVQVFYQKQPERCIAKGTKGSIDLADPRHNKTAVYEGAREIHQLLFPEQKGGWVKRSEGAFVCPRKIEISAPKTDPVTKAPAQVPAPSANKPKAQELKIDDLKIDSTTLKEKGNLKFENITYSDLAKYAENPKNDGSELDKIYKTFVQLLKTKNPKDIEQDPDLLQMMEWIVAHYRQALPVYRDSYHAANKVVGFIRADVAMDNLVNNLVTLPN
jgi:hypothetical protein